MTPPRPEARLGTMPRFPPGRHCRCKFPGCGCVAPIFETETVCPHCLADTHVLLAGGPA